MNKLQSISMQVKWDAEKPKKQMMATGLLSILGVHISGCGNDQNGNVNCLLDEDDKRFIKAVLKNNVP